MTTKGNQPRTLVRILCSTGAIACLSLFSSFVHAQDNSEPTTPKPNAPTVKPESSSDDTTVEELTPDADTTTEPEMESEEVTPEDSLPTVLPETVTPESESESDGVEPEITPETTTPPLETTPETEDSVTPEPESGDTTPETTTPTLEPTPENEPTPPILEPAPETEPTPPILEPAPELESPGDEDTPETSPPLIPQPEPESPESSEPSIPLERMGINGEYDQMGLAKRVIVAFEEDSEISDLETFYVAQIGSTVVLKGQVPTQQLLDKMVTVAKGVSGTTAVDVSEVIIAAQ